MKKRFHSGLAAGLATAAVTLAGCAADSQQSASVLPPKYLQIDQFERCLQSRQVGSHTQWCMPVSRPASCPVESWEQLNRLQGGDRVPACSK